MMHVFVIRLYEGSAIVAINSLHIKRYWLRMSFIVVGFVSVFMS